MIRHVGHDVSAETVTYEMEILNISTSRRHKLFHEPGEVENYCSLLNILTLLILEIIPI